MKCSYCGQTLRDEAQFCSNCGRSVEITVREPKSGEKGAYALSVISLIAVLALMVYGCYMIISRDVRPAAKVSQSDSQSDSFNYDSVVTDPALTGTWLCSDPAAADYGDKDFGVNVSIVLTMNADGTFVLDYSMTDTGIQAAKISASGTYSTGQGKVTFVPEKNDGIKSYLERHGSTPSFGYLAEEDAVTLIYENGAEIVFTSSNESN